MSKVKGILKPLQYINTLHSITEAFQAIYEQDKKRLQDNGSIILVKKGY